ncbi:MAG: protein O-mannosyl-transferase family [Anaerolineales bacterium]
MRRISNLQSPILSGTIGLLAGFGLARLLFEYDPTRFGALGAWPGVTLIAALAALVVGGQAWLWDARLRRGAAGLSQPDMAAHLPLLLLGLAAVLPGVNPLRNATLAAGAFIGWAALRAAQLARAGLIRTRWIPVGTPIAVGLCSLWLYLRTLAPTVGAADTFEFQVNVIRLGINHGSGYPLYMLLAKLFSWLPVGGTAAFRINLSSAAFGALGVVSAYGLARTLAASRGAAAVAALALTTSIGLWSRAVEAEVYTLNVALVGAVLYMLLQLQAEDASTQVLPDAPEPYPLPRSPDDREPPSTTSSGRRERLLPVLFLLLGLSFANHLTTGLLLPAVAAALLLARPRAAARTWALAGVLFLSGLALYLYLPIRWPAVNGGELLTFDQFVGFLTGREAHGAVRPLAFLQDASRYSVVARKVLEQFGIVGAALAGIGIVSLAIRRRRALAIMLLAWLGYIYFGVSFYVPDPDFSSFLLPAHLLQAVWMAVGVQWLIGNRQLRFAALTALALLPLSNLWLNYARVDKSNQWQAYETGRAMLTQPLAAGATILADSEKIAPLYYLQTAEGIRPDLDIVVLPDEATYRAELDARIAAAEAPVYLGRYLPHLAGVYHPQSAGALAFVSPEPIFTLPDGLSPLAVTFGEQIELAGWRAATETVAAGDDLELLLAWRALRAPDGNYLVHARLVDREGNVAQVWPGQMPVHSLYPTDAWLAGETVADFHALPVDIAVRPGAYTLQIGLFAPFSAAGLPVDGAASEWTAAGNLHMTPPEINPPIAHPVRMQLGDDLWLRGFDIPATIARGSPVEGVLYWSGGEDAEHEVELTADGQVVATMSIPTDLYPPGAIIPARASIPVSGEQTSVALGVRSAGAARCGWLVSATRECTLTSVAIEGEAHAPGAANFDNQIVLDRVQLENSAAQPGDTIVVTAAWHGLRAMTEDYTVFVHLLGPDGFVHGQVDTWPVQGTLPTSEWQPGQPVADRYEIYLPTEAPAGSYRVEVGWYLLATLERLPVLNAEGMPIDDKYLEEGLMVVAP